MEVLSGPSRESTLLVPLVLRLVPSISRRLPKLRPVLRRQLDDQLPGNLSLVVLAVNCSVTRGVGRQHWLDLVLVLVVKLRDPRSGSHQPRRRDVVGVADHRTDDEGPPGDRIGYPDDPLHGLRAVTGFHLRLDGGDSGPQPLGAGYLVEVVGSLLRGVVLQGLQTGPGSYVLGPADPTAVFVSTLLRVVVGSRIVGRLLNKESRAQLHGDASGAEFWGITKLDIPSFLVESDCVCVSVQRHFLSRFCRLLLNAPHQSRAAAL